jgi:site-specific DNA-methyltransferase (adenine-specific)
MQNRTLYFGDNLEILREKIPDESFDLIYLDPPFNSNRSYNVIFREGLQDSPAQVKAFEDSWHWTREAQATFEELVGVRQSKTKINEQISNLMLALEKMVGHNDVLAYLTMMAIRLIELRRVLKPTGSIYLHCDPTASHYLKIVMDALFGKENFQNEIIWGYGARATVRKSGFPQKHDVLLVYSKTGNYFFNPLYVGQYKDPALKRYNKVDERGRRYALIKRVRSGTGEVYYGKTYPKEEGAPMTDVWDIPTMASTSKERLGYATQKPEALLGRIIKASSKEGDWVLDPFCGCGTTVAVAERLNRQWVGIDITMLAINLIRHRLARQFDDQGIRIFVDGRPRDVAAARALFKKDPFEFEYWVLDLVDAVPAQNKTKGHMRGADKGIDGVINFIKDVKPGGGYEYGKLLVQVKGGVVHRDDIATLKGDVEREKASGGLFIALEKPTQPMREEAVSAGSYAVRFGKNEFPKIQILTVEELLNNQKPKVPLMPLPYYKEAQPAKTEGRNNSLMIWAKRNIHPRLIRSTTGSLFPTPKQHSNILENIGIF